MEIKIQRDLVVLFTNSDYNQLAGRGFDSRWCHWNFSLT